MNIPYTLIYGIISSNSYYCRLGGRSYPHLIREVTEAHGDDSVPHREAGSSRPWSWDFIFPTRSSFTYSVATSNDANGTSWSGEALVCFSFPGWPTVFSSLVYNHFGAQSKAGMFQVYRSNIYGLCSTHIFYVGREVENKH